MGLTSALSRATALQPQQGKGVARGLGHHLTTHALPTLPRSLCAASGDAFKSAPGQGPDQNATHYACISLFSLAVLKNAAGSWWGAGWQLALEAFAAASAAIHLQSPECTRRPPPIRLPLPLLALCAVTLCSTRIHPHGAGRQGWARFGPPARLAPDRGLLAGIGMPSSSTFDFQQQLDRLLYVEQV